MTDSEFIKMVGRLRPVIVSVSLRFLRDGDEAEDATQDTLLRLWTIRDRIGDVRSAQSLATVICKNICISRLRVRRTVPLELASEVQQITEQCAQWALEEKENAEWLAETIDGLPAAQMTILKMSQQDGLENGDIANILGISETTVRTALCKARKSLLLSLQNRDR